MNLIANLSGKLIEGEYREPRGAVQSLFIEPQPGVHLRISLGAAGLLISRGADRVAIPIEALLALVTQSRPELIALPEGAAVEAKKATLAFAAQLASKPKTHVKPDA